MRDIIKKWYHSSNLIKGIIDVPKIFYDFYRYKILSDEAFLRNRFKYELGYKLNLKDPKTFNEKIQWLKINDRSPLHTLCADKYAVREYVSKKIGADYLIPQYLYTQKAEDINHTTIPDFPVIIKATHSSGQNFIIRDKSKVDFARLNKMIKRWLKENFYYKLREWQYKNIPPGIVIEKLLQRADGKVPYDYKIHCFHGEVEFIELHANREDDHSKVNYDKEWNVLDFKSHYKVGAPEKAPNSLKEMISVAEKLSSDFKYVRIDLYDVDDKVYFSEITFHPGSGFRTFEPFEKDLYLGSKIMLG